jgi:hypothetical protein
LARIRRYTRFRKLFDPGRTAVRGRHSRDIVPRWDNLSTTDGPEIGAW